MDAAVLFPTESSAMKGGDVTSFYLTKYANEPTDHHPRNSLSISSVCLFIEESRSRKDCKASQLDT